MEEAPENGKVLLHSARAKRMNVCFYIWGYTTNQRNILFGCLLQLLVQEHQGTLQCFLDPLQFTIDALVLGDFG
jgi:hypothetical protein